MNLHNTLERFGWLAMLLHWLMALLIGGMLALGLYMVGLPDGDPKWGWYGWHKSFGMLIFLLLLIRLAWRLNSLIPPLPEGLNLVEKSLAHITHYGLYLAMIILPVSGYIDSSAGGYHLSFFEWFDVPKLIDKDKALEALVLEFHWITAYVLMAILAMHVGAALKHHLVLKDNVLLRMLPGRLRK